MVGYFMSSLLGIEDTRSVCRRYFEQGFKAREVLAGHGDGHGDGVC
jgi:hypothetical protein